MQPKDPKMYSSGQEELKQLGPNIIYLAQIAPFWRAPASARDGVDSPRGGGGGSGGAKSEGTIPPSKPCALIAFFNGTEIARVLGRSG